MASQENKKKISVSMDERNLSLIDEVLEEGLFRSRSHVLEYASIKLLKEKNGEQ